MVMFGRKKIRELEARADRLRKIISDREKDLERVASVQRDLVLQFEIARAKHEEAERSYEREIRSLRDHADHWRQMFEMTNTNRDVARQNLAALQAQLSAADEDEPPVDGALSFKTFGDRLDEIWGDGLSVEEMRRRHDEYLARVAADEPAEETDDDAT